MFDYDLIVIGAGPGGYTAALKAAEFGKKTAVVEMGRAGGTCLNRGCIPTKALLHASGTYRETLEGSRMGIHAEGVSVSFTELFGYKDSVVETLRTGVETLLKNAKIPLICGRAVITGPHSVSVSSEGPEEKTYTADAILIATGSVPARPPVEGLDLPGVFTSDELLKGSGEPFSSIVIIGGGVIGIEFATFYADLGIPVTVVEGLDRLLPAMDRELGQGLALLLKTRGVSVVTGAMVKKVERTNTGLSVRYERKGAEETAEGEAVLCAIGRRPYWDGLFAEGLVPEAEGRRLLVGDAFETSIPGIYAIGDVSSKIQLAHAAAAQGVCFAETLCGRERSLDLSLIPACVYARPEIASVGLSEADAKITGRAVKTGKCVMGANARTLIASPGRSFIKLTADAETGELLGAVLMCERATDMIPELAQAIVNHMTPAEMLRTVRAHPTFAEALTDALNDLMKKLGK